MLDPVPAIAAALCIAIGCAHSWLGERYILTRLFRRPLPPLFGSDEFTRRTLRFAWHLTTVAWWGFGALLLMAGDPQRLRDRMLWTIVAVFAVHALVAALASRGRHLSWIVFGAIAALSATAACGDASDRDRPVADVVSVAVTGGPQRWSFAVGVASPDTGCDRYADWWEVVTAEGELVHRRILAHSHVDEQPFVRRGGPVEVAGDRQLWVRAHLRPGGYGGTAFRGSIDAGFEAAELAADFAADLELAEPQPSGCAW